MTRIRWAWRQWRARHYAYAAYVAYQRWPSDRNADALVRADAFLSHVQAARP